jgi:hypothetical protein
MTDKKNDSRFLQSEILTGEGDWLAIWIILDGRTEHPLRGQRFCGWYGHPGIQTDGVAQRI